MSYSVRMSATEPQRIGIRELRQHASTYVDQVEHGATIEVTRHGRPVARLSPVRAEHGDRLSALVDSGIVRPAEEPGDLLDIVPAEPSGRLLPSEALRQMRDEERW
jgi:prevent-host-death family protein